MLAVLEFLRANLKGPGPFRSGCGRGSSVPSPCGLVTSSVPSSAPTRSPRPLQARALAGLRAADAVVADVDHGVAVLAPDLDAGVRGVRVLGDVGQRLGDDEVGRGLHRARAGARRARCRARRAPRSGWRATRAPRRGRAGRAPRDGCPRRGRAAPSPPPARWRTRCRRAAWRLSGLVSNVSRASWSSIISATSRCWAPSCRSRREPAALGVTGFDEPGAGGAQRFQAGAQLHLEPLVLERERRGGSGLADELGLLVERPGRGRARRRGGPRGRSRSTSPGVRGRPSRST